MDHAQNALDIFDEGIPNKLAQKVGPSFEKPLKGSALYRALLLPYTDIDAANEAMKTFVDGVSRLRIECGIPDVLLCIEVGVAHPDADDGEFTSRSHARLGDAHRTEGLAAYVYGASSVERAKMTSDMEAEGRKKR